MAGRTPLRVAIGLAVPAIEAWYRCGLDPQVTEAGWAAHAAAYTRNTLKQAVYGMERPSLELETQRAVEAAQRLAGNLPMLEQLFPGFRTLAEGVRGWN
jgi:hypothetical protein